MKRLTFFLVLALVLAVVYPNPAGAVIRQLTPGASGSLTDTLALADSTGATLAFDRRVILDRSAIQPDIMVGNFLISAFVAAGGDASPGGIGLLDSGFITVYTGWGDRVVTIFNSSCASLPCSLTFEYYTDIVDTTGGVQYAPGLWLDHYWFTYRMVDTTGGLDTISASLRWTFRFFYME